MKVLLTGGAGFVGSSIVEQCLTEGLEPIIIDDFSTGHKHYVPEGVAYYCCDIRDHSVEKIFQDHQPDIVIHQAAQVSVAFSTLQPQQDCDVNIRGTLELLQLCVKYNVSKFIFASSAAVYGAGTEVPFTEKNQTNPISCYGISKLTAERYIRLFHDMYGLKYVILRYSNVYGKRQNINSEAGVIAKFIQRAIAGQTIDVYGDGHQTRDFIHVRDVARANIIAALSKEVGTFNCCSSFSVSLHEMIQLLKAKFDHLDVRYTSPRVGDIRESRLSNECASEVLRWTPQTDLRTGVLETIAYYENTMGVINWKN